MTVRLSPCILGNERITCVAWNKQGLLEIVFHARKNNMVCRWTM